MNKNNLPVYELIIEDDNCIDNTCTIVNKISLVTSPAIEMDFVAFDKKELKTLNFKVENPAQRKLIGVFMVPNQKIYRVNQDALGNVIEEYYVMMSKETIEKAVKKFFKYGYSNNTNLQHETDAKDVYVIESWITTQKNDKLLNYGFKDVPEGSWAGTIFVENEQIWDEFIKTGILKGFSIEGNFVKSLDPIKEDFSQEIDMGLMCIAGIIEEFIKDNNK